MKTVQVFHEFDYWPTRRRFVRFQGGVIYRRVIEAAVAAIVAAGAGRVVLADEDPGGQDEHGPTARIVDARHAWNRRR